MLTSKDLSFVGYIYKNFDVVKGLHYSFGMNFLQLKSGILIQFKLQYAVIKNSILYIRCSIYKLAILLLSCS